MTDLFCRKQHKKLRTVYVSLQRARGELARVLATRALYVYQQGFLGSGAHGNQRKHHQPPSSSSSFSSSFPVLGTAEAPKHAKMNSTVRSEDQYYEKITSIQQSMHER